MADIPVGLSFDDVLLLPQRSSILPSDVDLSARLTPLLSLGIPVISAAMDTVTECEMAIALAREGGLGVIHRNNKIEDQAQMVSRVKRAENAIISKPFVVRKEQTISQLRAIMDQHGFSGFPVVDEERRLEGIVTGRDLRGVEDEENTRVFEVMTPLARLVTAPANTSMEEARRILYQARVEKLPLVDENQKLTGLITAADIENRAMFTNSSKDANGQLLCGAAVGPGPEFLDRAKALVEAGVDAIFIDAATGHTTRVMEVISKLRELSDRPVIAGNVVTAKGASDLIDAGASGLKVGVGPGSICTTRIIAGVGMPQFSAIQAVAPVARARGVAVIADGGIRFSGDVVKALAAGADFVMLGGLLAGTGESPGAVVHHQGRRFKQYRGMGSLGAMRKGSSDRYGQNSSGKLVAEGVEARVPFKGSLSDVVYQLMGGLRSGMGYLGAQSLEELRAKAEFVRITVGGLRESHPHDITITEEPVNYQPGL